MERDTPQPAEDTGTEQPTTQNPGSSNDTETGKRENDPQPA